MKIMGPSNTTEGAGLRYGGNAVSVLTCLLPICGWFLVALISLSWGQTPDPIVVVVNKENPVDGLTKQELARIYRGERETWRDGQKIIVINQAIGAEIRRRFYASILETGPGEKFYIPGTPLPFHTMSFKSDVAIKKFVENTSSAIGYLPLSQVQGTVKILRIDELMPGATNYPLE